LSHFLKALNQTVEELPPPASSLLFEYYTDLTNEVYIRVIFNDQPLSVCGAKDFCTSNEFHQFLHLRAKYYLKGATDIRSACWNPWTEGMKGFDLEQFSAEEYLESKGYEFKCKEGDRYKGYEGKQHINYGPHGVHQEDCVNSQGEYTSCTAHR
jgi:hypothetical protein